MFQQDDTPSQMDCAQTSMARNDPSHLHCRGRVQYDWSNPMAIPQPQGRDPGVISDVKLDNFHSDTGTVVIRMDTWQNASFWAECHIELDQLQQWLLEQGIEMTWKSVQ